MSSTLVHNLFGMHEMEECVRHMLESASRRGIPFQDVDVGPLDFDKNPTALVGLCALIAGGWLAGVYSDNEAYRPTIAMIERMRTREQWKDMPYPLTAIEWDKKYRLF